MQASEQEQQPTEDRQPWQSVPLTTAHGRCNLIIYGKPNNLLIEPLRYFGWAENSRRGRNRKDQQGEE